ncbi:MAG: PHP domain-containing protein [Kiritimatiellia bacterium]|nr:PHP domain-containing protein [Kiritimatiellia bacterium]
MIDLHCHSTCSDGMLSPGELVKCAVEEGVRVLALTDHDTLDGVTEFQRVAAVLGLRAIPGVEVSAEFDGRTMHILGYFAEPEASELQGALSSIRNGREIRNRFILEKLAALGKPMDWEEIPGVSAGGVIGRPHIARAMVERGYVRSMEKAFEKFLARGCPAYVERFRYEPEEIFRILHAAGGVAVLAHPGLMKLGVKPMTALIERLAAAGLDGLEVAYPDHTSAQQRKFNDLARRLDLIPTGGSDYHGMKNQIRRLGRDRAAPLDIAPETPDLLLARAQRWRLSAGYPACLSRQVG